MKTGEAKSMKPTPGTNNSKLHTIDRALNGSMQTSVKRLSSIKCNARSYYNYIPLHPSSLIFDNIEMAAYKQFIGILAIALIAEMALGTDLIVGAPNGSWNIPTNLTAWVATQTFTVNDNLIFKYSPGAHNVYEVTKSNYDSCGLNGPLKTYTSGDDKINLSSAGTRYFICGIPTHCSQGMKVQIDTSAASTPPPSSTPTMMSPPITMSPPPPPSGGSNLQATAAGGVGFGLLMLLAF